MMVVWGAAYSSLNKKAMWKAVIPCYYLIQYVALGECRMSISVNSVLAKCMKSQRAITITAALISRINENTLAV